MDQDTVVNIDLKQSQKKELFQLMEKYDQRLGSDFSNSLSRVITNQATENDLLTISSEMDYGSIDFIDNLTLDSILGITISLTCFNLNF